MIHTLRVIQHLFLRHVNAVLSMQPGGEDVTFLQLGLRLSAGFLVQSDFAVGCAFAPSVEVLLVLRVLQGIGGGFGMVLGRAVLIDMTDGPEVFRIMNIMQGVGGVAPIVAPLLGGIILVFGQWREIFLVIAVMSLI